MEDTNNIKASRSIKDIYDHVNYSSIDFFNRGEVSSEDIEDIVEWYHQIDPLKEVEKGVMSQLNSTEFMGIESALYDYFEMLYHSSLRNVNYEFFASVLILNAFCKNTLSKIEDQSVNEYIEKNTPDEYWDNPLAELSSDDVIAFASRNRDDMLSKQDENYRELEIEDLNHIQMGAEMLWLAGNDNSEEHLIVLVNAMLKRDKELADALSCDPLIKRLLRTKRLLISNWHDLKAVQQDYAKVLFYSLFLDAKKIGEKKPEAKLIALDALMRYISINYLHLEANRIHSGDTDEIDKKENEMLIYYINFIREIFIGGHKIIPGATIDLRTLKGAKHEALWLLDFLILNKIDKTNYYIVPSTKSQDSPHNGYKKQKRGFDNLIISNYPPTCTYVQLKSGKDDPNYHPWIDVYAENNYGGFNEVLEDRLAAKLNILEKFIEKRYPEEQKEQIKKSYILKSVIDAKKEHRGKVIKAGLMEAVNSSIKIIHNGPNREQKRAAEKAARKKKL